MTQNNSDFTEEEKALFYKEIGIRVAGMISGFILVFFPVYSGVSSEHAMFISGSGLTLIGAAVSMHGDGKKRK